MLEVNAFNLAMQEAADFNKRLNELTSSDGADIPKKAFESHKTYLFGSRQIALSIYYGLNELKEWRYWVNFSSAEEKAPWKHGVPFHYNFETQEKASAFRDKLATWLGLVELDF